MPLLIQMAGVRASRPLAFGLREAIVMKHRLRSSRSGSCSSQLMPSLTVSGWRPRSRIAGSASSGVAAAMAEQAGQNKVLFISGPAAADALTGINGYTFRSGRQSAQDVATAGTFLGDLEGKTVTVFAQNNAFGQGNEAAVKAILGAKCATVNSVLVAEDVTEFTPFAQQVLAGAPDLVFVAWAGATSGAMWQAMSQQGVFDKVPVVTGLGDSATVGPASLVMRGESVPVGSRWSGNPIGPWRAVKVRAYQSTS